MPGPVKFLTFREPSTRRALFGRPPRTAALARVPDPNPPIRPRQKSTEKSELRARVLRNKSPVNRAAALRVVANHLVGQPRGRIAPNNVLQTLHLTVGTQKSRASSQKKINLVQAIVSKVHPWRSVCDVIRQIQEMQMQKGANVRTVGIHESFHTWLSKLSVQQLSDALKRMELKDANFSGSTKRPRVSTKIMLASSSSNSSNSSISPMNRQ